MAPSSVFVESSGHRPDNLGDVAMLQALVRRLRDRWPAVRITVPTIDVAALRRHCPEVEPLPARGLYRWREGPRPLRRLPPGAQRRLARDAEVRAVLDALVECDAFVLAGRGGTTDTFLADGLATLDLVEAAIRRRIPVAAFGQGVGPLHDPTLLRRTGRVLARLDVLTLREGRHTPGWLAKAHVPADGVEVVGDEAIELVAGGRRRPDRGFLGVNLRTHDYAGVGPEQVAAVAAAVAEAAPRLGTGVVGVPISLDAEAPDVAAIRAIAPGAADHGGEVRTVAQAAEQAARCRLVVTGSYHAALFALAQGIPAIGLHGHDYYVGKFEGLAERFGPGVEVLDLRGPDVSRRLVEAIERGWALGPDVEQELVAAAARQVDGARAAFDRFARLVDRRA